MDQPNQSVRFLAGAPSVGPIPIHRFFTREYYELEKERVFKKTWLRVGLAKDIPRIGDYFVKELEVCDTSIVVVRGKDERIRAFHNACSHRTNRVAYGTSGNVPRFTCKFHSWSYGLDGKLLGVPEHSCFHGMRKEDNGLTEVACDVWEGFIFINVDPSNKQTLRDYIGEELVNGYEGFFERMTVVGRWSAIVPANWKICKDAFDENYHFSTVHTVSAGDLINSRENPNGRVDAVRLYPRHHAISVIGNARSTPTFAQLLSFKFSAEAASLSTGGSAMQAHCPPQMNPLKIPEWFTDIVTIFPMCWMSPMNGFYLSQDFWPLSHESTRWEMRVHINVTDAASAVAAEYTWAFFRDALREDAMNLKMIQSNLNSGAKRFQHVGEMEALIRHSYQSLAEHVGEGLEI